MHGGFNWVVGRLADVKDVADVFDFICFASSSATRALRHNFSILCALHFGQVNILSNLPKLT
jgi:hypothetical protein